MALKARGPKKIPRTRACMSCGRPAHRERLEGDYGVIVRAWCLRCLEQVRDHGVVDLDEYPDRDDSRRAVAPRVLDFTG